MGHLISLKVAVINKRFNSAIINITKHFCGFTEIKVVIGMFIKSGLFFSFRYPVETGQFFYLVQAEEFPAEYGGLKNG
jgi:hypothetical protein